MRARGGICRRTRIRPSCAIRRNPARCRASRVASGFAATPQRGLDDMVARSGAGSFVSLPPRPVAAAELLEQFGDPVKGGVLGSAVFADGPSRYGYAGQSPLAKVDVSGLLTPTSSGPFSPRIAQTCALLSCADAYYACLTARGGLSKAGRVCGQAAANCNKGLTTIFGPGIVGQ